MMVSCTAKTSTAMQTKVQQDGRVFFERLKRQIAHNWVLSACFMRCHQVNLLAHCPNADFGDWRLIKAEQQGEGVH